MPWLPFYASGSDFDIVRNHINATSEFCYLVSAGPGRWKAVPSLNEFDCRRIGIWHVPSGALPLLRSEREIPGSVEDPYLGWTELRRGADSSTPYFGAGHSGVFWLNVHAATHPDLGKQVVGLSSFEWIGSRYRVAGNDGKPEAETAWKRLGRWMAKSAKKVPRGGTGEPSSPEIWAFPHAAELFSLGAKGARA